MLDLAGATRAYEGLLEPDLLEFAIDPLDRVGVPVWQSWWTATADGAGGIGYALTPERARVGALGELAEHACAVLALAGVEPVEGSLAQLRSRVGVDGVADPRLFGLPAGSSFADDRPLRWLGMRRLADGAPVLVPAELVAGGPGELSFGPPEAGWLVTPVSNGMGAGSTFEQAVAHAVLETLQRDGNGLRFRALDAGVVVDLEGLTDPDALETLKRLQDNGVRVQVKLATTDFGLANVYAVGSAEDDDILSATACGEAVHPDRDAAVRKALLEFANARARKQFMHGPLEPVRAVAPPVYESVIDAMDPAREEQWVLEAMVDWLREPADRWRPLLDRTVFRERERVALAHLPTTEVASGQVTADVAARLAAEGFDVLVRDLSPADHPDVHAVKVLVPGLEVETVAYHRIGARNVARLLAQGRDDLVRVGDEPSGDDWATVALTAEGRDRLGGPAWLNRPALTAVADGLRPLYREPSRHTAQKRLAAGPVHTG